MPSNLTVTVIAATDMGPSGAIMLEVKATTKTGADAKIGAWLTRNAPGAEKEGSIRLQEEGAVFDTYRQNVVL